MNKKGNPTNENTNATRPFNAVSSAPKTAAKTKKKRRTKPKKVFSVIMTTLLTVFLIGFITAITVGSVFAIYIKNNLVEDFDIADLQFDIDQTTKIYYEKDGEFSELEDQRLYNTENRSWVSFQDMPSNLIYAFVAIEDQRFFTHPGIDLKRTGGAILTFATKGTSSYGGSTITQQLIKNLTKDNDTSVQRKIREIFRALSLEKKRSKEEIIEMYLNTIQLSYRSYYGVQAASNYYFGKDVSELSLTECAALAAIPKSPSKYDPIRKPEENKFRRKEVMNKMLELEFITQKEYDEAFNADLVLNVTEQQSSAINTNSYFTDALIEQIIADLEKEYGYPRNVASNLIFSGGLQIYSTVDPEIQDIMEEVFEDPASFPAAEGIKPEAAMVVMDPETGNVLGIVGGRGEKETSRGLNRATMSKRQIGSSIKPILVYAPAVDLGYINYATVIDDSPVKLKDDASYWPKNSPRVYDGLITVNYALEKSKNTVAVKVMEMLTPQYAYEFATQRLGITTLVKDDIDYAPLALGGLTHGMTVLEVTGAYTMLANEGIYSAPRLYTEVLDSEGNVLLSTPEQHNIAISESTSQVMTKMLQNVVERGTGAAVTLKKSVEVAGKTGSTDENKDQYFVGYTPYYLGACWYGYDIPKYLGNNPNPALRAWDLVMTKIHEEIIADAKSGKTQLREFNFDELVEAEYCKDSGLAPCENCLLDFGYLDLGASNIDGNAKKDARGERIETGWFKAGTEPTAKCDTHVVVKWDKVTNCVACENCPEENIIDVALVRENERSFYYDLSIKDAQFIYRDVKYDDYCITPGQPFFANMLFAWATNEKGEEAFVRVSHGNSDVSFPANRYCLDHIDYEKPEPEPEDPGITEDPTVNTDELPPDNTDDPADVQAPDEETNEETENEGEENTPEEDAPSENTEEQQF